MDYSSASRNFTSELGKELVQLQSENSAMPLNSTHVKHIIVTAEDTRIAMRLSQLHEEIYDLEELEVRTTEVENLRLNLISGQQCIRDFFICINENLCSWPDVFSRFGYQITHSTRCTSCGHEHKSETLQSYSELQVPPHGSNLKTYVEEYFNDRTSFMKFCEDRCNKLVQAEQRANITKASETEFITVILSRAEITLDGYHLNTSEVITSNEVLIR